VKYLVIIPDGLADYPLEELGGRTPVEAAQTPNLDTACLGGLLGLADTTCSAHPPGSDVATMCLLGYNPDEYYSGRAPLEAASMGVELAPDDVAVRCNLITADDERLIDYSGGVIPTEEAHELLAAVREELGSKDLAFYAGVSYRNILVLRGRGELRAETNPPHDVMDQELTDIYPTGEDGEFLTDLIKRSREILSSHPINRQREKEGQRPANLVWFWGAGNRPAMPSFQQRFGRSGAAIAAVDLVKGLARVLGWDVPEVEGATGYLDTNYAAKAEAGIKALEDHDFALIHIEAPDEAGHEGNAEEKIKAIESIDEKIVGPCWDALRGYPEHRMLAIPDHPTPIAVRTHVKEPVPFALRGTGVEPGGPVGYSEANARSAALRFDRGYELMGYFLGPMGA